MNTEISDFIAEYSARVAEAVGSEGLTTKTIGTRGTGIKAVVQYTKILPKSMSFEQLEQNFKKNKVSTTMLQEYDCKSSNQCNPSCINTIKGFYHEQKHNVVFNFYFKRD